jgi:hypothetical protein
LMASPSILQGYSSNDFPKHFTSSLNSRLYLILLLGRGGQSTCVQ